ncbi:MAG: RsmB/NOP family class I SAM-dependent RNA methyltransferase [Myxococcales bacterium]
MRGAGMATADNHGGADRSSTPADPALRLRAVPWEALHGLTGPVCAAVAKVLAGAPADRALDKLLRAHKGLQAAQRAAVVEAVFGVALWRRRLAAGAGLPSWEGADPGTLLHALLRDLGGVAADRALALSPPAATPVRTPAAALTPASDSAASQASFWLGDRYSLPDWLARTLVAELGAEAEAFAASICAPGPICLRANALRGTREALAESLARDGIATRPGAHAPHALVATGGRPNLLGSAAHARGLFEAQDEGSQLLGALVQARPGDTVLDACAGAGGKSLLLAAELRGRGRVVAVDPDAGALARLAHRARRAGADCIEIAGARIPAGLAADRVLVDAPCSELGPLRRGPDTRFRLRPDDFEALPALQLGILADAARVLRPGGRLVYATCTVRRAENQAVAASFERAHPAFVRVRPGAGWLDEAFVRDGFFVALPHLHGTDGFFAAVYDLPGPACRATTAA